MVLAFIGIAHNPLSAVASFIAFAVQAKSRLPDKPGSLR
jgi:hypothetical protein